MPTGIWGLWNSRSNKHERQQRLYRRPTAIAAHWTLSAEEGVAYDLMKLRRYDECILRMEHLLAVYKEGRAETDKDLMHVRQWLAESYMKTNQAKRAERIADDSYRTASAALGEDHLLTQVARNSLAQALESQGEYALATTIFEELHESVSQAKGPEDIQSQTLANNLAMAYLRVDRVDDAIPLTRINDSYSETYPWT